MTSNHSFYLNILLLNKNEVVANTVGNKTGLKTGIFGKAAAFAANKLVTDEKIINNLSATLTEKIGDAVIGMGISADIVKKFQKGSFVVFKVTIHEIDKEKLILTAKGENFSRSFQTLITSINELGLTDSVLPGINEKIFNQVQNGMMTKFGEVIPLKLHEAGLDVDCTICSSSDQAEFFFETVETLN
eukprot:gene19975-25944_t